MGDNNSKQSASVEGQAPRTFREILNVISKKTGELQDIIKNIKGGGLDEHVARPYLVTVLETTEAEINTLKCCLSKKATQSHHKHNYQQREQEGSIHANHDRADKTDTVDALKKQLELSLKNLSTLNLHFDDFRKEKDDLNKVIEEHTKQRVRDKHGIEKLKNEKQELLLRYSKLSSDKLTTNNPEIADLSDPCRPTKLVEMMSELYDNEWTDAFTALTNLGKNDQKVVKILLDTFLDVFYFCKAKSAEMLPFTETPMKELFENTKGARSESAYPGKAMSTTTLNRSPHQRKDQMRPYGESTKPSSPQDLNVVFLDWREKDQQCELDESLAVDETILPKFEEEQKNLRKSFGDALVPIITKAYLRPRWNKDCTSELKPYIKKCVHVAWLMCIQTPPMGIAPPPRRGERFDTILYKHYVTRGQLVEYTVWPAVLLKEPKSKTDLLTVMQKGVVEGKGKSYANENPNAGLSTV